MWAETKRRFYAAAVAVLALAATTAFAASSLPTSSTDGMPVFLSSEKELLSNRFTHPEPAGIKQEGMGLEGFELLFQNRRLAVYFRSETGAIRIQDLQSGYVWGSLAEDKPDNLNKSWAALANSIVTAEIYDKEGMTRSYGCGTGRLTYRVKDGVFQGDVYWEEPEIGFSFSMELTGDGLCFSARDDSIREEGESRLKSITFVPFLGAAVGEERQGYIFVPDGCGALMRFTQPRGYLQGFSKRVYGLDYGIDSMAALSDNVGNAGSLAEEETISYPVFGMVHGARQNAYFAVLEQGEEYAWIKAEPAGVTTDYNRVCGEFIYRQAYEQPISRTGAGVQVIQKNRNTVNPQISYHFLSGEDADYVGMAKAYRDILERDGQIERLSGKISGMPIQVDFLAADVQKEFIGTSVRIATDYGLLTDAVTELNGNGVGSIRMGLLGWQRGGLNGGAIPETKSIYGDLSEFGTLQAQLKEQGGVLQFSLQPLASKPGQLELRRDAGISLSQSVIEKKARDPEEFLGDTYYRKTEKGLGLLGEQVAFLTGEGIPNWRIDGIGYLLYGEYLDGGEVTRSESRWLLTEAAAGLAEQSRKLSLVRPNSYLYPETASYHGTPMVGSQYLFETDTVPFLQIVLSGYVEMFAPYTNLSFYSQSDILKQIDYNTYPAYLLTGEDNHSLRNTASSGYQSTKYEDWKGHIAATYEMMNDIFLETYGQAITGREVLAEGLVKNVYEKGAVYINYTPEALSADGALIPAQSAVYLKGGV